MRCTGRVTGLADFEMQWISDEVAEINTLGLSRIDGWLAEHSQILGFGELTMSEGDLDRIGQRLMSGLAVIGQEPRTGHSDVDSVPELWEHLSTSGAHPLIAARAARNLWRQRCGTAPHEHGRRAMTLFEDVAGGMAGRACERAEATVEALELAAELRDVDITFTKIHCSYCRVSNTNSEIICATCWSTNTFIYSYPDIISSPNS